MNAVLAAPSEEVTIAPTQNPYSPWLPYTREITGPGGGEVVTLQGIEVIFKIFLHYAARIAGLLAFIMLIAGGFKYLTAGGDKKAVESAQKTITYAVLGLAFLIGAWLILVFVENFTGVKVTQFVISPAEP